MLNDNEVRYELKCTIKYPLADGTGVDEARFITLKAPTVRSLKCIGPIKQAFMQCVTEQANDLSEEERQQLSERNLNTNDSGVVEREDGAEEIERDLILAMIMSSTKIDYAGFLENFIVVLGKPELASIDGEAKITKSFIDQLPITELEALAGEYVINFIAPSV